MFDTSPKAPVVSKELWKILYAASMKFRDLEPWKCLADTDLFCVKNPVTGEIGYCTVMGGMGEFFALGIYRAEEGFDLYSRIASGDFEGRESDIVGMANTLMAELCPKEELEEPDIEAMKAVGLELTDLELSPCFRSALPGSPRWFITEEEARYLIFALRCTCDLAEVCKQDPHFLERNEPNQYLCYALKDGTDEQGAWIVGVHTPTPVEKKKNEPYQYDAAIVDEIRTMKLRKNKAWEIGSFNAPATVHDRDRPYSPDIVALLDKESEFALKLGMASYEENIHYMACDCILEAIQEHKCIPMRMYFSNKETLEVATPLLQALNIKGACVRKLKAVEAVKATMFNHFHSE